MDLRNNILALTVDEDCPLGEQLVKKKFLHTLSVGFRKDTIRLEMMNVLKGPDKDGVVDETLLKEVTLVANRDAEQRRKRGLARMQ